MQTLTGVMGTGIMGVGIIKVVLEDMLYISAIIALFKLVQALDIYIRNNK